MINAAKLEEKEAELSLSIRRGPAYPKSCHGYLNYTLNSILVQPLIR